MFILYIFDIICFMTGMWKSLTSTKVKTDFAKVNGNITIMIVLHIFNLNYVTNLPVSFIATSEILF